MSKAQKNRASKHAYQSPTQFVLEGFETPFSRNLRQDNRWVILARQIPWDILVETYQKQLKNDTTGASGINPRVVIGSMIIKHMGNLSDRETVLLIQENIYMQYFIGYTSFSDEEPFDASLFVEFRKRLGIEQINAINEKILGLNLEQKDKDENNTEPPENEGTVILDATACPQDIAYPTDLNLLNDAREKAEHLIDVLFDINLHQVKPRTYRQKARKLYLNTAQKKVKSRKVIRTAIKQQLNFLKRNIQNIYKLMDGYQTIPLNRFDYKYLLVIQTLYDQQNKMFKEETHSVEHRIVSIHQPHVRPIVRGKSNANVEFGAKIQVSLMNGYAFLDDLQWEAFNEGTRLEMTIENFKLRFGCYPKVVMADKIYCNRQNRAWLKTNGIELRAKPLGRPPAVKTQHVSPGERNPIEGKFGQAKTAYGLNRIMARLQETSESWIATIVLVLNLVKLTGEAPYCILVKLISFKAKLWNDLINRIIEKLRCSFWNFELLAK
jgi:transposase, IS5 family